MLRLLKYVTSKLVYTLSLLFSLGGWTACRQQEDSNPGLTKRSGMMSATRRPPEGALVLEWVFGYNGHTARNNVKVNAKGHLVYYVAGVGVVHDHKQQRQKFFTGHSDDISSLALNSERRIAATGQVGDNAYIAIWDAVTCEPLSVIHDAHSHQVVAIAFSHDSKILASAGGSDVQICLVIWDWQKGRRMARHDAHVGKVEEVEFQPDDNSKLVTCGAKQVKFWTLKGNVIQANLGIFDKAPREDQISVTFLAKDTMVSGSLGGHLLVWAGGRVIRMLENIHPGGVSAIESFKNGIITGGCDGTIKIFDETLKEIARMPEMASLVYKTAGPIQSLSSNDNTIVFGTKQNEIWILNWSDKDTISGEVVVQGHGVGEVWGLSTHPSQPIVVTGSDDGTIRLWSLNYFRQISSNLVGEEVRSVAFSPSGEYIAAGLLHGAFLILTTANLQINRKIVDRKESRQDIRYSPNGRWLAVASNENVVDLYDVQKKYTKLREIGGISSFVTHIDWSIDSKHIQINSGAGERIICDINGKGNGVVSSLSKGIRWSSWTCVLGNEVKGLWAKYSDLSDVNAVDANFRYNIIVSGDDFGLVKLFRFPCPKKGSKPRASVGHSAHVTNVRWTFDSSHVVSLGGADHAIFVWSFKTSRPPTGGVDVVRSEELEEEDSGEDVVDTEDELEAIPEITGDLEDELTNMKSGRARSSFLVRSGRIKTKVEIRDDSAFAKRLEAAEERSDLDEPPAHYLRIAHIFGYRSYDSRDNCHWLKGERIVYHVAAVGIVCNPKTDVQGHYVLHTDDIHCLAVHPEGELVATGQVGFKPCIQVWDSVSLKILSFLGDGHEIGVAAIAFSADGERIVSIGMDIHHTAVVWKWLNGNKIASVRTSMKKVFGARFSPTNSNQLITFGVRHLRVWTVVGGGMTWRQIRMGQKHNADTVLCSAAITGGEDAKWVLGTASGQILIISQLGIEKSMKAHKGAVYSIFAWSQGKDGTTVWTGGRDGLVCQWDKSFQHCLKTFPISDHSLTSESPVPLTSSQSTIRSLSWHPDSRHSLLVGTQNSEILLVNTADGQIKIVTQGHCKGEVWGLATHPRLLEAVSVSDDRTLRRWSLEGEFKSIGNFNLRKPARCVDFHPEGIQVAIGFLDGSVALYSYPGLNRIGGAHHRQERIADVKFSPDGRMLAVASHDSFVDLYVVDSDGDIVSEDSTGLKRLGVCRDASSFISHVTWHKDSRLLQINSGAGEQLFYESPKGMRVVIPEKSENLLAWASPLTSPLDVTVSGIWQRKNDLSDINTVATAHELPLVAVGYDEEGLLKLFRYPCRGKAKRHRQYAAHSSHLTKVLWTFDDTYVITCGGADTAVVIWGVYAGWAENETSSELVDQEVALPSDISEGISSKDLEVCGLSQMSPLPPVVDSKRLQFTNTQTKAQRQSSEQLKIALQQLRSSPVIMDDDDISVFFLHKNIISRFGIKGGQIVDSGIAYKDHDSHVTTMAISSSEPFMMATASIRFKTTRSEAVGYQTSSESYKPVELGALVHIWHPKDGSMFTAISTENTDIVTCLSFSPNGRFLAVLADASLIHVFNWVKAKEISKALLKTGGVVAISYSTDTTVAALTPKALYLCDMVGNALLPTRTLVPPGIITNPTITFTSLSVDMAGKVYVGCSDASVVQWSLRIATRRGSRHPANAPSSFSTYSGVRTIVAVGNGRIYVTFRSGNDVVVHIFETEGLSWLTELRTPVPQPTWNPSSVSIGRSNLVIGAVKGEPIILLDLTASYFYLIKTHAGGSQSADKFESKKLNSVKK